MGKNKDFCLDNSDAKTEKWTCVFLRDFLAGICIGVAFIIPGFSGGSVAAILGIYEKMVGAIANVFKEMILLQYLMTGDTLWKKDACISLTHWPPSSVSLLCSCSLNSQFSG